VSLQAAIYESHQKLGRIGQSYAIWLEPPPVWETIPALELLSKERITEYFERSIKNWTQDPKEEDIRAAASRFMRRYLHSVQAPTIVALANGVAWDLTLDRISIVWRAELPLGSVIDIRGLETFTTPERPTSWPVEGTPLATHDELRDRALTALFGDVHLRSFERVLASVRVSPRLLWSQAAEDVDYYYDYALELLEGEELARYSSDRERILFGDTLPGVEGANPLKELLAWDDFRDDSRMPQRPLQVRTVCCFNYVIPGRPDKYCRTCGLLSQEERRQKWLKYVTTNETATSVPWPPQG
jgi:ferric iron reductase protein FhuF